MIGLLISVVIITVVVYFCLVLMNEYYSPSEEIPSVSFPFKNTYDSKGKKLNVILITAPFREKNHEESYKKYKQRGLLFCGISSYQNFPDELVNPYDSRFHEEEKHDYTNMVSSWLHCFRPKQIPPVLLNSDLPLLLLTEADLKDTAHIDSSENPKEYDFMYVCLDDNDKCKDGWQSFNRNWDLAKKCLEVMCGKYKMKGLIVGRQKCELTQKCNNMIKTSPMMDYNTFQREMKKCKMLFVPNIFDASPRVVTEAMCYNIPILMNINIVGGWHNIIPGVTGEFFTDEINLCDSLDRMIIFPDKYQPKKWYFENRGKYNSGKELADFFQQVYGEQLNSSDLEYVYISII